MEFTQTLDSDGSCAASPTPAPVDPLCTQTLSDSGSITVNYDTTTELINMGATLPSGSYAGWGWGASMINTEMVIFSADGDNSDVTTFYSAGQ